MSTLSHRTGGWLQQLYKNDWARLASFLFSSIWILQVFIPWWTMWREEDDLAVKALITALSFGFMAATVAEIATAVFVAEGTARHYLSEAIAILSARNRQDAARIAEERGWL